MKTLILHIGMHKTGTSSIQQSLNDFDDGRARYLRLGAPNHSIPIFTAFSQRRERYHVHVRRGLKAEAIADLARQARKRLDAELRTQRTQMIIVGEDIAQLRPEELGQLKAFLLERVDRVRVLAYLRDPVSYCASAYQQMVQGGRSELALPVPRYRQRFEKFIALFGRDAVELLAYDRSAFRRRSVISDFCDRIGIVEPAAGLESINQSVSVSALKGILALNRLPRATHGSPSLVEARHELVQALARALPGEKFRLPATLVQEKLKLCELDWLYQQVDWRFDLTAVPDSDADPDPMTRESLETQLQRFDPPERDAIAGLVASQGLSVPPQDSPEAMIDALFCETHRRVAARHHRRWPRLRQWVKDSPALSRLARAVLGTGSDQ